MKEQFAVQRGVLQRVSRYAIGVGRRLAALTDKTEYQMVIVYSILEKQQEEINELKAHIQELRDGVLRGSDASARRTSYGTLGG